MILDHKKFQRDFNRRWFMAGLIHKLFFLAFISGIGLIAWQAYQTYNGKVCVYDVVSVNGQITKGVEMPYTLKCLPYREGVFIYNNGVEKVK